MVSFYSQARIDCFNTARFLLSLNLKKVTFPSEIIILLLVLRTDEFKNMGKKNGRLCWNDTECNKQKLREMKEIQKQ